MNILYIRVTSAFFKRREWPGAILSPNIHCISSKDFHLNVWMLLIKGYQQNQCVQCVKGIDQYLAVIYDIWYSTSQVMSTVAS